LRKIQSLVLLTACIVLSSVNASAQAAAKQLAVHAGRLIDVRTGQVTKDAYILIAGERIVSIGTTAPSGATVVDMSKFTIVPGLIDAHGHTLDDPTSQSAASFLMTSAPEATVRGVNNLQVWLAHGFTAVRDACEAYPSYPQFALRDGVAKGLITGPRIVAAGSCVSLTGGHGDSDYLSPDKAPLYSPNLADSPDEINRVVRRDIKYGADWIKLMATGGVMDPISDYRVQELSEEQMARAVEVAHRAGKKVMAHAEGTEGIKAAVRAGVDSIEHGTMLDDEEQL
jgi:imidazolonepropionase-like amidohydrolase